MTDTAGGAGTAGAGVPGATASSAPAMRLRGGLLITLAALSAFGPISLDLYLPAFPSIADSLGVSTGDVQLTFAACLLGLGLGQLVYGPLSDRYGRKPPLIGGLVLYVVASLLCAAAPSLWALTGLRFVQGLGGCAGLVIARAIVRDGFDGPELTRSFSVIASVSMIAPLLAPSAGAAVLQVASWRVLFVVIALFGAACLVAALRLPETHPRHRRTDHGVIASIAGYGSLLRQRRFVLPASIAALGSGTLLAYISSSSVVLMTTYGVGPAGFALIFAFLALWFIIGIRVNLVLLHRRSVHQLLRLYVAVEIAALVVLLVLLEMQSPLWAVLAALAVVKACLGGIFPNATAESMQPFKRSAGSASALLGTMQFATGGIVAGILAAVALAPGIEMAGSMLVLAVVSAVLVALPLRAHADEEADEPGTVDSLDIIEGSGSAG